MYQLYYSAFCILLMQKIMYPLYIFAMYRQQDFHFFQEHPHISGILPEKKIALRLLYYHHALSPRLLNGMVKLSCNPLLGSGAISSFHDR